MGTIFHVLYTVSRPGLNMPVSSCSNIDGQTVVRSLDIHGLLYRPVNRVFKKLSGSHGQGLIITLAPRIRGFRT